MTGTAVAAEAGSVPLLGGELLTGSDGAPADGYGDWLVPLLTDVLPDTGRVLVVGRHEDSLLTALADRGCTVDLVLRSLPDARTARIRLAAAGVRVRCGGLDRIPVDDGYHAVLALDDPARLYGPDHPPRRYPETLARLAALARPGAAVVVAVPNPFGLDELTATGSAGADGREVPYGLGPVRDLLAAAGLPDAVLLAAYPGLVATAAALRSGTADTPGDPEVPARLVAAAYAAGRTGPVLADPARLAHRGVRHGLGLALAPSWLAVAYRHADTAPEPPTAAEPHTGAASEPNTGAASEPHTGAGVEPHADTAPEPQEGAEPHDPIAARTPAGVRASGPPPAELAAGPATGSGTGVEDRAAHLRPALVVAERDRPAYWSVPRLVRHTGAGWRAEPLVPDTGTRVVDHLRREPARLAGAVPVGPSLADQLADACGRGDLVVVRELVTGYRRFLAAGARTATWRPVWADPGTGPGREEGAEPADAAAPDAADEPGRVVAGDASGTTGAGPEPVCAADRVLATCDAVLVGPDGYRLADPSWSSTLAVPVRLVFLRGLQRFAYRLLVGGRPHPWPAGLSPDRLAATLAATADVTVAAGELADAAALAVHLTAPLAADGTAPRPAGASDTTGVPGGRGFDEHAEALRYVDAQRRAGTDPALAAVPPRGYAEAWSAIGALTAELADARAQIAWLDDTVAERDRRLAELGTLRRSVTYRIGYLATFPYHLGIRLLRRELRRLRG